MQGVAHGILILTAAELEARALARELELPLQGALPFPAFGRGPVRLAPVGLRGGLLERRWASLLDGLDRPLIVSAGVCAGLDPRLRPGDLVLPESVIGPLGGLYNVTPSRHLAAVRLAALRGAPAARTGALCTIHEVAATPAAKAALLAATGAVAADMESAVILAAAAAAGCPSLVVRGVSDGAAETLPPELADLVSPEGRLRRGRALAVAVTRPAVIPRALALGRATRRALRAVAVLLAGLVE